MGSSSKCVRLKSKFSYFFGNLIFKILLWVFFIPLVFAPPANKYSSMVSRMESLSRITNGISLEIGLRDGSITFDTAIANLLRMGSNNPNNFIDMDMNSINDTMSSLECLSENLHSSSEITLIEEQFILFNEIIGYPDLKVLSKPTAVNDYKNQLNLILSLSIDISPIPELQNRLTNLIGSLAIYDNWSDDIDIQTADDMSVGIQTTSISFRNIEAAAKRFAPSISSAQIMKALEKKATFRHALVKDDGFRRKLAGIGKFGERNEFIENIRRIHDHGVKTKDSMSSFSFIKALVESRGGSHEGWNLDALTDDIHSDWFRDSINNRKSVIDSLEKLFGLFDASPIGSIEESWRFLEQGFIKNLISTQEVTLNLPSSLQKVSASVDEFEKCQVAKRSSNLDVKVLDTVFESMEKLDQKLALLSGFAYYGQLQDLSTLRIIVNATQLPNEDKVTYVKRTVRKLIDDQKFQTLRGSLISLQKDLISFDTVFREVKSLVDPVLKEVQLIEKYYKELTKPVFMRLYECLWKIGEPDESTEKMIKIVREVRQLGNESESITVDEIAGNMSDSQDNLKIMKGSLEDFRKMENLELSILAMSFPDSKNVSSRLTKAVQGLKSIQYGLEAADGLTPLLDRVDMIVTSSEGILKNQTLKESVQKLKDLVVTVRGMEKFRNETNALDDFRIKRIPVRSNFKNLGKMFELASKIPSFHVDHQTLKEALDALNQAFNHQYFDVMASLDTLQTLNLNFQSFEFKKSIFALESLDNFFATFASSISNTPSNLTPPPSKPLIAHSKPTPSEWMMTSTEPNGYLFGFIPKFVWISCLVAVILSLIVAFIWCFFFRQNCCCCCKKIPNEELDLEQPSPIPESTISKVTTPAASKVEKPKLEKSKMKSVKKESAKPKSSSTETTTTTTTTNLSKVNPCRVVAIIHPKPLELLNKSRSLKVDKTQKDGGGVEERSVEVEKTQLTDDECTFLFDSIVEIVIESTNRELPLTYFNRVFTGLDTFQNNEGMNLDLNLRHRRFRKYPCRAETMAKLAGKIYVNASVTKFGSITVVVGQTPQTASLDRNCTIQQFLAVIYQYDIGIVVQLCGLNENGSATCANYFPLAENKAKTFGNFTVTTEKVKENVNFFSEAKLYTLYKIKLEVRVQEVIKTKFFDVLIYQGWSRFDVPVNPETSLKILSFCDSYKTNMFVCSSAGVGRAGTLFAIKYGVWKCQKDLIKNINELILPIREIRYGSIENVKQMVYALASIEKGVMEQRNIQYRRSFDALFFYNFKLRSDSYLPTASEKFKQTAMFDRTALTKRRERDMREMKKYCDLRRDKYEKQCEGIIVNVEMVDEVIERKKMEEERRRQKEEKRKQKKIQQRANGQKVVEEEEEEDSSD